MEKVEQSLYKAMRDDSEAVVGIRALLGNTTANPYNVYYGFFPEAFDFSGSKSCIAYQLVASTPDNSTRGFAVRLVQDVYQITVYSPVKATLESVHRRIKLRLHDMRNVALPSSQAELHKVDYEGEGATNYDDAKNVYWRHATYRAYYRDDNLG